MTKNEQILAAMNGIEWLPIENALEACVFVRYMLGALAAPKLSDERIDEINRSIEWAHFNAHRKFARALLAEAQKPAQPAMGAPSLDEREALTDERILEIIKACPGEGYALIETAPGDMECGKFAKLLVQWARALLAQKPQGHQAQASGVCGAKSALSWTSVAYGLPRPMRGVLVWCPDNKCHFTACLDTDGKWTGFDYKGEAVAEWAPLPPPHSNSLSGAQKPDKSESAVAAPSQADPVAVMRQAMEALTEISAMYTHAWDRAEDGALFMLPPSIPRFEAAHKKVKSARDSLRAAISADPDQARVSPPPPPENS